MKRIVYILSATAALLLVSSCNDFLRFEQKGEPSSGVFWKSEADAKSAADGLYFWTAYEEITGRGMFWYINVSDDMVTGRPQTEASKLKNFQLGSRDCDDNYATMYQLIKRCNDIIRSVPDMQISQNVKNMTLGQAYFFRAWAYFWIAPYYGDNGPNGGIPILTENTPLDSTDMPRPKSVMDNYTLILSDLDKAGELLPHFSDLSQSDWGRPHKTACWAYAAKCALYAAEYDAKYYAVAENYADKVITSGKHRLLNNYADVFSMTNNWSSEYIWSFTSNEKDGSKFPGVVLENKGWGLYNGWGYFMPTVELLLSFEPGDQRRGPTMLIPGDQFMYLGTQKTYYSTESASGMQFNKYMDPFKTADAIGKYVNPNGDNMTTRLNIPLFRYAEILLIKAEAAIWQGKSGDNEINLLRQRAGLLPKNGCSKADLKHERRVELAGEWANRHKDLVRWGDAKTTYSNELRGLKATVNSEGKIAKVDTTKVWDKRNFDPTKNHVFPIPLKALNGSKTLKQNIGY